MSTSETLTFLVMKVKENDEFWPNLSWTANVNVRGNLLLLWGNTMKV
jgi:hypothetical protein